MEKKPKVNEIYECINLLSGATFTNGRGEITEVVGFCNERYISEGIRRIANKTLKKLRDNYPLEQFNKINSLGVEELYDGKLPEGYTANGEDNAKLAMLKQGKIKELLESEVVIEFEELPDWRIMNSRLEDNKQNLSYNYTYLFERLFLNY